MVREKYFCVSGLNWEVLKVLKITLPVKWMLNELLAFLIFFPIWSKCKTNGGKLLTTTNSDNDELVVTVPQVQFWKKEKKIRMKWFNRFTITVSWNQCEDRINQTGLRLLHVNQEISKIDKAGSFSLVKSEW